MKSTILLLRASTALLAAGLLLGCSKKSDSGPAGPQAQAIKQQSDLMTGYFQGDAAQARKSLQQLLQLYQDSKTPMPSDAARTQRVYETYCRLFVLETRTGNQAAADAALAKVSEAGANLPDADKIFAPDKILAMVDGLDLRENHRQPAKYARGAAH